MHKLIDEIKLSFTSTSLNCARFIKIVFLLTQMFVCRPRRRHAHAPVGTPPGYLVGRGSHEESLRCRFRRRCVRARKEQRRESRPKWMTTPPVGALYPEINSMLNLCPMDRRARSFIHFRSLACAPNFLAARPPSDPEPDFAPKTHFSNKSPRFLPSARFDSSKQISPASFFLLLILLPYPTASGNRAQVSITN